MSRKVDLIRVPEVALLSLACSPILFAQGPPVPSAVKKASEVYKNVQVLKDVPSDQLIPAMQFITSSLGVQCGYCHVENAFDKDDKKPKQIARKMMQMEFAIDTNNFQGKQMVTCYSCHRGSPHPLSTPLVAESQAHLLAEAQESGEAGANLPRANDIIAKYIAALGGEAAIAKLTSLHAKGTIEAGGRQFPVEIFVHSPDQFATITQFPNGEGGSVFNGHEGWLIFPGRPPHPMTPADVDGNRMDADLHFPANLNKIFSQLKVEKTVQIGGQDAIVVFGQRQGLTPVELYFDNQNGFLVREVRYGESPLGKNPTQIDYSDYRDVSGVKMPFRRISATPTGRSTIQIESAQTNVAIPADRFAKPAGTSGVSK
ncbi:MAG TPA: c-type cytochrome [Terriglobales bacterium]|nr:c-type cytochrome [Terriglobales bacterium]